LIRELLTSLFVHQLSYPDIQRELNIDQATLRSRIDMLTHMGYVKKTTIPFSSGDSCDGGCAHCYLRVDTECENKDSTGDEKTLTGFELTEKGKRLLEK